MARFGSKMGRSCGWFVALSLGFAGCGGDEDPPGSEGASDGSGAEAGDSGETGEEGEAGAASASDGGEGSGEADSGSADETGGAGSGDEIELLVDGFEVPATETSYNCFEFTFNVDQLAHITSFTPIIDNAPYVHHFVVTLVDEPSGQAPGYTCFDLAGDMVWAWAPGVETFELPEEAGYLVGDKPGGQVTLRLQVHYNNPLATSGEVDSSGFAIRVTDELRPHDAGTLVFGDIQGISIPPGEPAAEHIMTCRSEVTAQMFEEPLHVFGSSMHAHEIGSVLWTEVYRDGEMIMELNRDDPYLFDSQHIKPVDVVLEPGDEVVNHCVYDSTGRTDTTVGGPGTEDEMCWNTIMYYPKIPSGFDMCTSYN